MPHHKNTSADFWRRVHKTDSCWEWQGARLKGKRPYGKLTWELVHTIRAMHAQGIQHRTIAAMLGMSRSTIHAAIMGKTWRTP